jgi:hypothetical protein
MVSNTRETASSAGEPIPSPSGFDESVAALIGWSLDAWLSCQANILHAIVPATALWIERRRDGATATIDAFERLAACAGLEEAAAIHREWIAGSARRLDEDWRALADHAVCLSQELVAITRRASPPGLGGTLPVALPASPAVAAIEEAA